MIEEVIAESHEEVREWGDEGQPGGETRAAGALASVSKIRSAVLSPGPGGNRQVATERHELVRLLAAASRTRALGVVSKAATSAELPTSI